MQLKMAMDCVCLLKNSYECTVTHFMIFTCSGHNLRTSRMRASLTVRLRASQRNKLSLRHQNLMHQGLSDTPTGAVPVPGGIMWKFINIIFL